uniref:Uncharacterized protein n=1 Tax=Timema poppense TaxID=170557 RepID=A0A7R9H230_TIMPO|nr:unnamed protein product [Timema poppensis]
MIEDLMLSAHWVGTARTAHFSGGAPTIRTGGTERDSVRSAALKAEDHMQDLCKNHFLQQLYRKIDGAVLQSQNERNLDCVITFQTHSILQRFMLRFDLLQLDCNDHLFIYDGAHAVGNYKARSSKKQTLNLTGVSLRSFCQLESFNTGLR